MSSPTKIIFLTGAPDASSLQWGEKDLASPLLPCFEDCPEQLSGRSISSSTSAAAPSWRFLPLEANRLSTGLAPKFDLSTWHQTGLGITRDNEEASFLSTTELSLVSRESSAELVSPKHPSGVLSQFLEHSFAVHEDLPSSQISTLESSVSMSLSAASWKPSSDLDCVSAIPQSPPPRPIPRTVWPVDLRKIPSTKYLHSMVSHTTTIDIIVGIISIPQPRPIRTRRGDRMELIEMVVGDDTKAGFGVSLWLPPVTGDFNELRKTAIRLRSRDIILLRNVALSSFRGNVYGQSLRRDRTKLDLLYRNAIDEDDDHGAYSLRDIAKETMNDNQLRKVKKVRDWILMFVGADQRDHAVDHQDERKSKRVRLLPPDSQ